LIGQKQSLPPLPFGPSVALFLFYRGAIV